MKVDAYISGEVSEQTFHAAQESGVAYIAAGHHATERYGIGALGEFVAQKYKLKHQFVDIPNPVWVIGLNQGFELLQAYIFVS